MFPFQVINLQDFPKTEHKAEIGTAYYQTFESQGLRIRTVEYSAGYLADHWCEKGHIVHCLEGTFISELSNGQKFTLTKGMTYLVSDNLSSHRSFSLTGVKLLIIEGSFLQ